MTGSTVSGRWLVLPVVAVVVVAAALVVAYKLGDEPPQRLDFVRVGTADGNAMATEPDPALVHVDRFLERHLDLAAQRGNSSDDVPLRIEGMVRTLESVTGSPGPEWLVSWKGTVVRVTWIA